MSTYIVNKLNLNCSRGFLGEKSVNMKEASVEKSKEFLCRFDIGTPLNKVRAHYRNYIENRTENDELILNRVKEHKGYRYRDVRPIMKKRIIYIFGGECAICGNPENLEIHHIIPRAEGGTNDIANLLPLCHECHCAIHKMKEIHGKKTYEERFENVLNQNVEFCNCLVGGKCA
jgi:5-methylcytosine-specific restriction endonuclease McrA